MSGLICYAKEAIAFYQGKVVQARYAGGMDWFDISEGWSHSFTTRVHEYRIKPRTITYRVAIMKDAYGAAYPVLNRPYSGDLEACEPNFVKWDTEWKEVEL